jgi:hypothetical protein
MDLTSSSNVALPISGSILWRVRGYTWRKWRVLVRMIGFYYLIGFNHSQLHSIIALSPFHTFTITVPSNPHRLCPPVVTTLAVVITHTNISLNCRDGTHCSAITTLTELHFILRRLTTTDCLHYDYTLLHSDLSLTTDLIRLTTTDFDYTLILTATDWIQLGRSTDIVFKRSERTRWKHRLRHLFYCRVTY